MRAGHLGSFGHLGSRSFGLEEEVKRHRPLRHPPITLPCLLEATRKDRQRIPATPFNLFHERVDKVGIATDPVGAVKKNAYRRFR